MSSKQPYNSGVDEIFSNFSRDPCLEKTCKDRCPVGFTAIRAVPPRSGEFRLDFSGCNFKCPYCWTINKPLKWSPEEVYEKIGCRARKYYESNLGFNVSYLRVTGGEPILHEERAYHLLKLFKLMDEGMGNSTSWAVWKVRKSPPNLWGRRNVKIQTNGILIPALSAVFISELRSFKNLSFTFEVSLKGTNPFEFNILSGGVSTELFFTQIQAIKQLMNYEMKGYPIFARGILGIFHSEQYDLVFPHSATRMMFNPSLEFVEVIKQLKAMPRAKERLYVEPLRFTKQMRSTEEKCEDLGILASSELGKNIMPGKKIPLSSTYLGKSLEN